MTKRFETPDPEAEMICGSRVSCWDLGPDGSFDRYTVVFLDRALRDHAGVARIPYLGMSATPYNPAGFGQHGELSEAFYSTGQEALGKRIRFAELPEGCRRAVEADLTDD